MSTQVINTMVSETEVLTLLTPTPALEKVLTYFPNKYTPPPTHTHTHTHTPLTYTFKLARECCMSHVVPPFHTHYGVW